MSETQSNSPNFIEIEHKTLKFWEENGVLQKYLKKNEKSEKQFSFLDGPITANNPMAVHHAWGRTLKDLYQRYKTMKGYRQRYQNGFDNQGLWVEVEVEKKLGFKSKTEIEKYGIAKFVEDCKEHTKHFADVQTKQSQRLGYFMDWGNDYFTMSEENNYAIWAFLKKCWESNWLYKGKDSVPWCPRCGTAISQHEILTEEYKELTHKSVFMRFPLVKYGEFLLVWTTTPWTIPGNTLVAVNPKMEYALISYEGKKYWVSRKLGSEIFGGIAPEKVVLGEKLSGLNYKGPFDSLPEVAKMAKDQGNRFHQVVLSEDLVNEEEGTGLVHIAPGCGTEDFRLARYLQLLGCVLPLVDEAGNYLTGFGNLSKKNAKDDPPLIFDYLGKVEKGLYLFGLKNVTHRYPVCWRCKTELIWRVVDEWYISMGAKEGERDFKKDSPREMMKKVIKEIKWAPDFGYRRELDWLNNMEDWLISKKRYWGLALPIWECSCGNFEVIGSLEELKRRAVSGWDKFEGHTPHRPYVDEIKIKCEKCGKLASRIPDVGNPWLDAGIVAYSTLKYFTDEKYFKKWFPADLVLECFPGQFKNWFYSLIAMSTVLTGKPPFKQLVGHGLVKNEKGEEMHKSKGNAIWFDDAAEKMGVDVMRWLYVTQPIELNLNFGYTPANEVRRRFILPLWNCYQFYDQAKAGTKSLFELKITEKTKFKNVLDRWIISRLHSLIREVTERLDHYDHVKASQAIENFVINDLSGWYIRRSRDRLSYEAKDTPDGKECLSVLHYVLTNLVRLLAPFTPFISEELWQRFNEKNEKSISVHLSDFPTPLSLCIDTQLMEEMGTVREVCALGHAERKDQQLKVRQPLAKVTVEYSKTVADTLFPLIKDELNVKEVVFEVNKRADLKVTLDTKLSDELKAEGTARDMMRTIQTLRKDSVFAISDKIKVVYKDTPENVKAVELFKDKIMAKTLAVSMTKGENFSIEKV